MTPRGAYKCRGSLSGLSPALSQHVDGDSLPLEAEEPEEAMATGEEARTGKPRSGRRFLPLLEEPSPILHVSAMHAVVCCTAGAHVLCRGASLDTL